MHSLRPDIGGLCGLCIRRYERFEVRTFDRLSDSELDRYLESNVAAVRDVADAFDPDVALANHLVMGPVILARAFEDVPYAVKIHGSALEYTVKPHYQRFAPYAREGLAKARAFSRCSTCGELGRQWPRRTCRRRRGSARPVSTRTVLLPSKPCGTLDGLVRGSAQRHRSMPVRGDTRRGEPDARDATRATPRAVRPDTTRGGST